MIVDSVVVLAETAVKLVALITRVSGRTVPRTEAQAEALAVRLYPNVARLRQAAAQRQWEVADAHMKNEYSVIVEPAPVRPYPRGAVLKAVEAAAGISGDAEAPRDMVTSPASVRAFQDRLLRLLSQHVQNAGRELIIDTANYNAVSEFDPRQAEWDEEEARRNREGDPEGDAEVIQFPDPVQERDESEPTEKPSKTLTEASKERHEENVRREDRRGPQGQVLAWARVLVGEVNCPFCAMLASRGAVYKSEQTAGFEAHNLCDCVATLVMKDKPWEGEQEAAFLQDLWEDARDNPTEYEEKMMEKGMLETPAARFRSRFNALVKEGNMDKFHSEAAKVAEERVARMRRRIVA